jgi:hypothetical protein
VYRHLTPGCVGKYAVKIQNEPSMPTRKVIRPTGMQIGFWKLKATSGKENKGIGPYGVLNKPIHPAQFRYLTRLHPLIIDEVTKSKRSP